MGLYAGVTFGAAGATGTYGGAGVTVTYGVAGAMGTYSAAGATGTYGGAGATGLGFELPGKYWEVSENSCDSRVLGPVRGLPG